MSDPEIAGMVDTVYQELRRLAGAIMRGERGNHTLQPTALVNEMYLRLHEGSTGWENRGHFFGIAAHAMRQVLVDHARKHLAEKRGGNRERVTLSDLQVESEDPQIDILALNQALDELSKEDPRLTRVMELRYFAGCTMEEIAVIQGLSLASVKRDWAYARAWLFDYLNR